MDEHVKLRESKNMTEKESVTTARGRERLNNTRRMGEERNRDRAADKIQEKVQISTEMEMENRHTYLGWPLLNWVTEECGRDKANTLRRTSLFQPFLPLIFLQTMTNSKQLRRQTCAPRAALRIRISCREALNHVWITPEQLQKPASAKSTSFSFIAKPLNPPLTPAQTLENKNNLRWLFWGWRSMKDPTLIPSHAHILEIHLHSSAKRCPRGGGNCGNMSDCLVKITIQLGPFILWKAR